MHITWRDGATTVSTAAVILLERAHFHEWSIPLIANVRWTVVILALLTAVGFVFSYVLDTTKSFAWTAVTSVLALSALTFAGLGFYTQNTDYIVLLMLNAAAFWIVSLVYHLLAGTALTRHSHAA